jgi:hypothetical protein
MRISQYFGIVLGALYGLLIRLLGGTEAFSNFYNIYSITFIWVTPIVISIIPFFFTSSELYKSRSKSFFFPVLAVLLFALISLSAGLEDFLCIIILLFPFFLVAGIAGLILGTVIKRKKIDKKLYSVVLLPLLLNPVENLLPNRIQTYTVETSILIAASREAIWKNIIEVPEISESEYNPGFFNFIGVPRPVRSELKIINGKTYRIGSFSGNLQLFESISKRDEARFVNFNIHLDKSKLRNTPTDQHLLKSNYFKFRNISYELKEHSNNGTLLILSCEYEIQSKMNGYASFWASWIIKDFEERLLNALKIKIEKFK